MKRTWEDDSCATVQACYAVYPVSVAAALWCGVPPDQVEEELKHAQPVGEYDALSKAILRHPYLKCLEPRIRAIHQAIDSGEITACRENGRKVYDSHVAYHRRNVYGMDLKEWAKKISPTERPAFLFDEIERDVHSAISTDAYRALKAAHDAKEQRLADANDRIRELNKAKSDAETERDSLRAMVENLGKQQAGINGRSETTYLNIIGALLELMLGKSPAGNPYSSFNSQSAIICALLGYHEGKQGISSRTLEDKFSAANKSIKGG